MPSVIGTNNSETIDAAYGVTEGNDRIHAFGGNDTIYGLGGDDCVTGGLGADHIDGGAGADIASYRDSTVGVTVSLLTGLGFGGNAEGDTLFNVENLGGSEHNDILGGDGTDNYLWGHGGHDTLKGGGGADTLRGGDGYDVLKGGGGADVLDGQYGIDTAAYNESNEGVSVSLMSNVGHGGDAEGDQLISIENLTGSDYDDTLSGNNDVNVLRGVDGNDWLKGYGGADTLWGGAGDDSLNGGEGNDMLRGEAGDDSLYGGIGADIMFGGYGSDTYIIDNANDVVIEAGGEGIDEVWTTVSYTLTAGADIELLRTTNDAGVVAIDLTGNSNGNIVRGNNGNNVIGSGDGNDELTGLGGQDSFLFDTALDPGSNLDVITDFNVADDTILLDQDIFSSSLGLGNISAGEFVIGTAAQDANDRIIYDSGTGALSYDSDGVGETAAVQFAELDTGLALTNLDFLVV